jgi:hypothetical protein
MDSVASVVGGSLAVLIVVGMVVLAAVYVSVPFAVWSIARSLRRIANHVEAVGSVAGITSR